MNTFSKVLRQIVPVFLAGILLSFTGCHLIKFGPLKTLGGDSPEVVTGEVEVDPFSSTTAPPVESLKDGGFAPDPALEDNFDPGWEEAQTNWEVGDWVQNGSQMDPSRARTNGEGQLVQTVLAGEPYRGGTMQTYEEFGYGRWVARIKPTHVPGILNSMFTKDWEDHSTEARHDGLKGEVDIEFLTYTFGPGKGQVHIAIHLLDNSPLWYADVELDFNPSRDYHVWGFDVLPDRVVWHVDGRHLHTWMYTDEHFIHPVYEMMFNSWTRDRWVNGPPDEDGQYHIDWVRFYPLVQD